MLTVHTDTIQTATRRYTDRKGVERSYEYKTVEVSIREDRRRVQCVVDTRSITVCGLAVRFRTGAKVWPGTASYWRESGVVNNIRPNIDKFSGNSCSLVGYIEDHEESPNRSKHNAVA